MTLCKFVTGLLLAGAALQCLAQTKTNPPLVASQTFDLPPDVTGHFDHLAIDPKGHRLFVTPEEYKAVIVLNEESGQIVQIIRGIGTPHAVLYREDLNQIYVTDGDPGEVHVYDGASYKLLKNIKLLAHTDSIAYDRDAKELYIVTGGKQAQQTSSIIAVLNTTSGEMIGKIVLEGDALEAMALAPASARLFVNNTGENRIDVVDTRQRKVIAHWPIKLGKQNTSMAIDEEAHLLFVGCRSGSLVVFDTDSGKEVSSVPMTMGVDDMVFDSTTHRIYASCGSEGGLVNVFVEEQKTVRPLAQVSSGPLGKTALLSIEVGKYFVSVPKHDNKNASVMTFDVH